MIRSKANPLLPIDLGGLTAILATAALIFVLGVRPLNSARNDQSARNGRLALLESQITELDTQILSLRETLEQTVAQVESRKLRLLAPGDLNARIAAMIERATGSGLEVLAIRPGELADGEHHGRTPIDIGLTGALPDLVRYLHAMRRDSADLVVQRIEITASPDGGGITAHIRADWLTRAE